MTKLRSRFKIIKLVRGRGGIGSRPQSCANDHMQRKEGQLPIVRWKEFGRKVLYSISDWRNPVCVRFCYISPLLYLPCFLCLKPSPERPKGWCTAMKWAICYWIFWLQSFILNPLGGKKTWEGEVQGEGLVMTLLLHKNPSLLPPRASTCPLLKLMVMILEILSRNDSLDCHTT